MIICRPINLKNQAFPRSSERGSAVLWVFIIIALFAALNFAFMQNTRSGGGGADITAEKMRLHAMEMVNYAQSVKAAVRQLLINGCDETEISFENSVSIISNYTNPNSPTNKSCHVFEPEGGGLRFLAISEDALDASWKATYPTRYSLPEFKSGLQFEGVGTGESELHMHIGFLDKKACLAINKILGVSNPGGEPPVDLNSGGNIFFLGTYDPPKADGIGDDGGHDLPGRMVFCRQNNISPANYQFNQVLIAR